MDIIINFARKPSSRLWVPAIIGTLITGLFLWLGFQGAAGPSSNPDNWRSITDIDIGFFIALIVGSTAYFISVWVWALRPQDIAALLFALSGIATFLFTYAAAIWLFAFPVGPEIQTLALRTNFIAASTFGLLIISLFLIYPKRLPHWQIILFVTIIIFGGWTGVSNFGPYADPNAVQPITFFEMLLIMGLIACQIFVNWTDPQLRAISIWFGSTVLIGAGIFIATIAGPQTFGFQNLIYVYYAFGSFLLIYVGLAIGLIRYRIFELGRWSFQLLSYLIAIIVIILVDLALVQILALSGATAISIAAFIVIFSYLPIRNWVWDYFSSRSEPDQSTIFKAVLDVAFNANEKQISQSWRALLDTLFSPLEIVETSMSDAAPQLQENGLSLVMPRYANRPGFVLKYPGQGSRLFSKKDLVLVTQALTLMKSAEASRREYDRGVSEERTRIAQDIHDNIGAHLMQALHSNGLDRKNNMIRATLTDLRDVINNSQGFDVPAYESLADLRAETADRLDVNAINLEWNIDGKTDMSLKPQYLHVLRSIIREATSNVIKHAKARQVAIDILLQEGQISCLVKDDGMGFDTSKVSFGHGLNNIKTRVESLGGQVTFDSLNQVKPDGRFATIISVLLPITTAETSL